MKVRKWKILEPKRVIGESDDPLMIRWILFRCPAWGLFVHKFCRSDHERALHDHPWPFIAWIIKGGYWERHDQTIDGREIEEYRKVGSVLVRSAEWRHRVILNKETTLEGGCNPGVRCVQYKPSWSIVLVGRKVRRWGFFVRQDEDILGMRIPITKWCYWRKYNPITGICEEQDIWHNNEDSL